MKKLTVLSISMIAFTSLSANAGLVKGGVKGTNKGVKEAVGGTDKGVKTAVGGTTKGVKAGLSAPGKLFKKIF